MTRKSAHSESGVILPIVLILMLALTITGLAFLNAGVMENSLVRRQIHKNQAFYLAEAGIEVTIWQFNYGDFPWSDPPWTEENGDVTRGPEVLDDLQDNSVGDYKVIVEDKEENNPVIESTGYVPSIETEGRVEKTVRVDLQKNRHPMFDYLIASGDGIKAEDPDTLLRGDIYTIGNITMQGATVIGNATATGSVINTGTITGEITEGAEELPFPQLDREYWEAKANLVIEGDLWVQNNPSYPVQGVVYVKGSVKLSNSTLVGPGTIVAESWIKVEEQCQIGTSLENAVSLSSDYLSAGEGDPAILVEGTAENSSEMWGALWAPRGEIKVEWATIHGTIVCGHQHKIETGSGVILEYADIPPDSLPSQYVVVGWWEE